MELDVQSCNLDGSHFECVEAGRGAPIVFLHGALGDWRTWRRHCELMSSGFRCISYTQRHFGANLDRSDPRSFGILQHAKDLCCILDQLVGDPVILVAWSYSGHVALKAAHHNPYLFSRLVLFEPGVRTLPLESKVASTVQADTEAMFGPLFEAVQNGDNILAAQRLIEGSTGPGGFANIPEERRRIYIENAHTMPLLLTREPSPPFGEDEMDALSTPVDMMWGEQSRPAARATTLFLVKMRPSWTALSITGAGHLWPEENPDAFCATLRRTLRRAVVTSPQNA